MTWCYPGRPVDEVELRLSFGEDGGTVLELEHASVADVFITNDPETGTWGIGPGWEAALDYLAKYLRGELRDTPARSGGSQRGRMRSSGTGVDMPGQPLSKPS